jgi:predicted DNA-binding protein (UPF0251 family)
MVRPQRTRRVAVLPDVRVLKPRRIPMRKLEVVTLKLDGLEALRLADLEGLYQEEAAPRMGVSRATFARILAAARRVLADAVVNGKAVEIAGGTVRHERKGDWPCPIHGRRRRRGRECLCDREKDK